MTYGKVSRQTVRNSILKIKVSEKQAKEKAKDYRMSKVRRASEYSKQTINSIVERKYDWSAFENENPIMNGASGTQNVIKQIGRIEAAI